MQVLKRIVIGMLCLFLTLPLGAQTQTSSASQQLLDDSRLKIKQAMTLLQQAKQDSLNSKQQSEESSKQAQIFQQQAIQLQQKVDTQQTLLDKQLISSK